MTRPGERGKVYVVDDDLSVRVSLCALLSAHGYRAAAFASAEDFLASFEDDGALCVFIDLRMKGMDGMALLKLLQSRARPVPVVILTAHGDVPLAVEGMKAGALDFIEKPGSEKDLLGALDDAAHLLANQPKPSVPRGVVGERLARLTAREREVLECLVLGMTNKRIADELQISQRTVEFHRARVREKMEASSLADLIRMMK